MKRIGIWLFIGLLFMTTISAADSGPEPLEVNKDGKALIAEAAQAYLDDMKDRPVVADPSFNDYLGRIIKRLVPDGASLPPGVSLHTTVIESPKPELYAYVDGHLVMTTGLIYAAENEAQLAGLLSHAVAHVVEGYYIRMYQEIKAAERKEARKAIAGHLFGSLLNLAVDYAVDVDTMNQTEKIRQGEATYTETMKHMATVNVAQGAYASIKDVISSIPKADSSGRPIDPRLQFEPVADAQGLILLSHAGYAAEEAPAAWRNVQQVNSRLSRQEALMGGAWGQQMRNMRHLVEMNTRRMQQQLGFSGLIQTPSSVPPSRAEFLSKLTGLEEVQKYSTAGADKGEKAFRKFLQKVLLPRAEQEMSEEHFEQAATDFQLLYQRGVHTAPIAYGLAQSKLGGGGFAFAASEAQKREAERVYREAAGLDPSYAPPYRGLGELYEDWERYDEAAAAYSRFLKLNPHAVDRSRIERKIKMLKRKASL